MTTNPPELQSANQQAQTKQTEIHSKLWAMIAVIAVIAVIILGVYFYKFSYELNFGLGSQADFGAFGDFIGGVLNPVLGFATVGLLIWSLRMQMKELALSREELSLTREELAETKEETALSRRAMEKQVRHLEREAYQNELVRLISDLRQRYVTIMSEPAFSPSVISTILNRHHIFQSHQPEMAALTNENVIYKKRLPKYLKRDLIEEIIKDEYDFSKRINRPSQWIDFEKLLFNFSNVVIKYHHSSKNLDAAAIYSLEALMYLEPFHNILESKKLSEKIDQLNAILEDSEYNSSLD